jgi:hypothetical protein
MGYGRVNKPRIEHGNHFPTATTTTITKGGVCFQRVHPFAWLRFIKERVNFSRVVRNQFHSHDIIL